jgi:acyl-CoA dehydrogenase
VERLWRDSRVFAVAPIPQEMILSFLATHDLGLPRSY